MEQISLFDYAAETEQKKGKEARIGYPDLITITDTDPLRNSAIYWAVDYDWHMAVHECEGLLKRRAGMAIEWPQGCMSPVIYCNAWNKRKEQWRHKTIGHQDIDSCPYCGVDLLNGKGTIIVERRFKDQPYHCVYERDWSAMEAT